MSDLLIVTEAKESMIAIVKWREAKMQRRNKDGMMTEIGTMNILMIEIDLSLIKDTNIPETMMSMTVIAMIDKVAVVVEIVIELLKEEENETE